LKNYKNKLTENSAEENKREKNRVLLRGRSFEFKPDGDEERKSSYKTILCYLAMGCRAPEN